jgi:thioredoxin-like negative regulator of GroEL
VLRLGLDRVPGNTDLQYQLGLALVRLGKKADALPYLKAAAASGNSHYVYVYAVGLYDAGQAGPSITALQGALAQSPDDTELLYGLASIAAAAGKREVALFAARRLATLEPGNPDIQRFVTQLEGGAQARP